MFANHAHAANAATADAPDGTGEAIAALTLDDRGMIVNCSRASEVLFKYNCSELFFNRLNSTGDGGLMLIVRPVIGEHRHEIAGRR